MEAAENSRPAKSNQGKPYPEAPATPDFPKLENQILDFWDKDGTFQASIDQRRQAGAPDFVFYDGPPFANGLPHYGHLVTGFVKDIVPRYQTMRGKCVERRFGWDCHGLPAELQAEKELGISGRRQILDYGMDKFNAHCASSVMQFTRDWKYYVTRQARWVDFENAYRTMDEDYMESVMWAFKTCWDKGLIYEDYRVVPYSWAAETPLSNFETRLDNSYRSRQDPAVTVAFRLEEDLEAGKPSYILAWTTTPWTLPSNLALAVGEEIDYAVLEKDGAVYVLAEAQREKYTKEFAEARHLRTLRGHALAGMAYQPLFPYFAGTENAFRILLGEFVDTGEGTGIVHLAPGFGEDDLTLCRAHAIPVIVPVDHQGQFTDQIPDYKGQQVFEANKPIIRRLKDEGSLIRQETIDHNYPHCWRTDQPLIYKAIHSWYLEVTKFRDRMAELNKDINWIPAHIRDGLFGNWLENARDWNIARNRFWGAPLPVWKSDNPDYPRVEVYGSLQEIEDAFGVRPKSLHRPDIDHLTRPNPDDPDGRSKMVRVEDVLDCWFESGSMPFAQVHYPFENKDWFEKNFPGDFIVEYIAQTRGWFYTLMVMATALFDRAPFQNCICHGVVLDENHQKLSKRLQNYPDPVAVFDTYGADALRWYLVSTPLMQGGDLAMPKDGRAIGQTQRQILNPFWNAYSFFTLYANADNLEGNIIHSAEPVLDRYLLAKTRLLVENVQTRMEALDIPGACAQVQGYLEALTNWYIRRARDRFWRAEQDAEKQSAYDTLYTALVTLSQVTAPFLPMLAEYIYRNLTGKRSVHLTDWPDAENLQAAPDLVRDMDRVREICSASLSIRETQGLRVRLPLRRLIVASRAAENLRPYTDLIAEELNVKEVELATDLARYGTLQLKPDPKLGKKFGAKLREIMQAAGSGDWQRHEDGHVTVAGETLGPDDYILALYTEEGLAAQTLSGEGAVILDITLTPELEREGLARDLIRLIQDTRKSADLHISDRIRLAVSGPENVLEALQAHMETICRETLTAALEDSVPDGFTATHTLHGSEVTLQLVRAGQ